jgi:phthalate 4,5-dioxygenase
MPAPSVKANTNPDAAADERRLRWLRNDPLPEFSIAEHEVGFVVGGSRRAEDEGYYWRLTQFMVPAHSVTPSALPGETYYAYTWVPITDEACWIYTYAWHPDRPLSAKERAKYEKGGFGQFAVLGPGFVPVRNRSNDFLIDREEQKRKSFTGVRGVAEQDAMAQASQGVIADRTREHLTPTDIGVVRFRRIMLDAAKSLAAGKEPEAPHLYKSYRLRAGGAVTHAASLDEVMKERFGDALGRASA